jgi:hypothetical protein
MSLLDEQNGFGKVLLVIEYVFTTQLLIEKEREFNLETHAVH